MTIEFASFWYGGPIPALSKHCLKSFITHGHVFRLFTYDKALVAPEGVIVCDASELYPESSVFFYQGGGGKVSAFSNMFRYRMIYETGYCWVDTDVICNSETFPLSDYLFAQQDAEFYNGAILRFPAGHEAMRLAAEYCWEVRDSARWGDLGPRLFTSIIAEYGLHQKSTETRLLYPIHWREAMTLYDPLQREAIESKVRSALTIHLWNEILSRNRIDPNTMPPSGSYLEVSTRVSGSQIYF